jgi:hypothetical protein
MIKSKTHGAKNKVCKPQGASFYLTQNKKINRATYEADSINFKAYGNNK